MGWMCTHKPKGQSVSDYFINDSGAFRWSDDSPNTYKVLDSAFVNLSEFYAAVEAIDKKTGVRRVWAAIVLVSFEKGTWNNFCYKDMDESCGPCAKNCPKRILDLLTPTEYEYALNWREACYQKLKEKDDCKKNHFYF